MKETINKKMKEASVLLITVAMVLSMVSVTANTNDNPASSLTSCTKGSNHMIFDGEEILSNEVLLWDNGDPDGRDGLSCMYWPSYPADREVVDDFDINETSWIIGGGHFRMVTYYGHTAEFIDGVNVFFYEDTGNKPSMTRYAERIAEFDAYNTGDYYFNRPEIAINVSFDTVELPTGKWWVCFQPVLEDNCFWLTAAGYGENVWVSWPGLGYPKWTEGYIAYEGYNDMSFKLFKGSPPPEKPQRPDGPTEGVVGVEYTFSTRTTDPEGEQVSYLWDWGDGTHSEWLGPFDSGATVYASHTWTEVEKYEITVKAKDSHGGESNWSFPKMIHIVDTAILEIGNITGGLFKVNTVIKNIGGVDAIKVNWSITLDGGLIILGKETSGNILILPAGDEKTISSSLIFGFGKTVITATAECTEGSSDTKTRDASVLLFFIF